MRSVWANTLRGAASGSVLVAHLFVGFWVNQQVLMGLTLHDPLYPDRSDAPKFALFLSDLPIDFAAFGVALFFLLSGFVISLSLEKYSRRGFLVGRVFRVIPTYAAGFLITCLVILLRGDPFNTLTPAGVAVGVIPGLGLALGIPTPSDGVVWTLIIEFVFYALCMVLYRRINRGVLGPVLVTLGCAVVQVALALAQITGPLAGIAYIVALACPFIPVMLVGMVLSTARRLSLPLRTTLSAVGAITVLQFLLLLFTPTLAVGLEYQASVVLAIALVTVAALRTKDWKPNRVFDFVADISYPLYVSHAVAGYATMALLYSIGVPYPLVLLAGVILVLVIATVLHYAVERPTHRIGQRLARRLSSLPSAPERVPVA